MNKPTILYCSDYTFKKTGFARHSKALLTYLYKTDKYNIVHYAGGIEENHVDFSRTPWKTVGCIPNNKQIIDNLNKDPQLARAAGYGSYLLDKTIKEFKPDIYIASQDFWGVDFAIEKKWWNKIPCLLHVTLDSLPIYKNAVKKAPSIENFWVWSEFAEKEMHRLGFGHVKTCHGIIDHTHFFNLGEEKRKSLRDRFGFPPDSMVIGFVFRNQLRKSVPNLLEGYSMFKKMNPEIKNTYLLLHTSFDEGWNIIDLANQYGISEREILTTYICHNCGNYDISPKKTSQKSCRWCGVKNTLSTTSTSIGVTESQLNEVYNLMDVYVHPFTSGGQEIPIQEAKLTELVTLVTDYSCGKDACVKEACSLPLEWAKYTEFTSEFIKASTLPSSIARQLSKWFKLSQSEKSRMGSAAREWTIKSYSTEVVAKKFENWIDESLALNKKYDFAAKELPKNPEAIIETIEDNSAWLISLYKNILNMEVDDRDEGHQYWMKQLKNGMLRTDIEKFFRDVATQDNEKESCKIDFNEILNPKDKKRVLLILPESIGDLFMATSLFKSIRERYPKPEWAFYLACKPKSPFLEILSFNPYLDKVIPYTSQMDDIIWLEGFGKHKGFFDVAYPIHFGTQRLCNYLHNGIDKLDIKTTGD